MFEYYNYFGITDLNADGKLDFWAIGNAGDNLGTAIFSILGNGNGTWQTPILYSTTPAGYNAGGIVQADFNNDGKPDFVMGNSCLGISCLTVVLQTPVVAAPSVLSFGTELIKGKAKPMTVTVTNAGTASVTVSSITFSGSNAADFQQTNNCSSLASEASCTVQVYFVPSIEEYLETATLSITETAPGRNRASRIVGPRHLCTRIPLEPGLRQRGRRTNQHQNGDFDQHQNVYALGGKDLHRSQPLRQGIQRDQQLRK